MRKFRYLIIAAIIALDQATKFAVRSNLQIGESIPVIQNFFSITHISNYGGALSMFEHNTFLLIGIPLAAMIAAVWYTEKHREVHWTLTVAIELIVAGGIGNLIDRISQGYVTDFIDFTSLPLWNWIFNVADIAVCVGCFLLVLYIFKYDKSLVKSGENKSEAQNGSAE